MLAALWFALTRDIRYSREYMGDLRNRVVGARLIDDGYSPYFYKYAPGDPVRYYDPQAFDPYFVSICTSTPFLHRLLIPLARLPFATIMRVWAVVLYLLYFGMTAYAFSLARAPKARVGVAVTAVLLLLTNAWELHTRYGQTYLLVPALAMLFTAIIRKPCFRGQGPLSGLVAVLLVLVRPNAVLFLLPFGWWAMYERRRPWKIAFLVPAIVALAWVLLVPRERRLWSDYRVMLSQQVKIHQGLGPKRRPAWTDPGIGDWEGVNMDTVRARIGRDPVHIYSENGNVFVLYQKIAGRRMPLGVLGGLGLFSIAAVLGILVRQRRPAFARANASAEATALKTALKTAGDAECRNTDPTRLAVLGFCLYMISDLFSPIYRHAYYGVQWFMPLLLAAAMYDGQQRRVYLGLLVCLLLNIVHLPFIPMANTIGEYGFLIGLLAIGFAHRVENQNRKI